LIKWSASTPALLFCLQTFAGTLAFGTFGGNNVRQIKYVLICKVFDYDKTVPRLIVDSMYEFDTLRTVPCQPAHPAELGGVFNERIGEWVIYAD
jgi:gamma-glutamyltranspeptidase